jgi:hypothetical protein
METLYDDKRIALRDLHAVYEALFLRAVTGFEVFLEELFVGILERKIRYPIERVSLRMKAKSRDALMEILLQGDMYLDWLPFDRTVDRAKLYLEEGKPFSELEDADKGTIKRVMITRNAIAHSSKHAMDKFHKVVIGGQALLRGERKPAGFLRAQVRAAPVQNRFEVFVAEMNRIASQLC